MQAEHGFFAAPGITSGIPARLWGIFVGAVITVGCCAAFATGLLSRLDDFGLDLHLRHFSSIEADDRIVMIDIDDESLRLIGDWPWPRRRHAQLIFTLHELGAEQIVLDLVLAEPMAPRVEVVDVGSHEATKPQRGEDRREEPSPSFFDFRSSNFGFPASGMPEVIHDDAELREAVAAAGNVYLAMFSRLSPPGADPADLLDRAARFFHEHPEAGPEEFPFGEEAHRFQFLADEDEHDAFYHMARLVSLLEQGFAQEADDRQQEKGIGNRASGIGREQMDRYLPRAKRMAARRLAFRFVAENPDAAFQSFFEAVLPEARLDVRTPDRDDLWHAFQSARSYHAVARRSPAVSALPAGRIQHAYDLTLPLELFAAGARGVGLVSFEREVVGGVVREIPPLVQSGETDLLHLGVLVAMDALGLVRNATRLEKNRLIFGEGADRRAVPLSPDGRMLIHWHVPRPPERWQDSFKHIPVARVLNIPLNHEAIARNERRLAVARARLVEVRHRDTPGEYAAYVEKVNRRIELRRRLERLTDPAERSKVKEELAALIEDIEKVESEARLWLQRAYQLWAEQEPQSETERIERDAILALHAQFDTGRLMEEVAGFNARIQEQIAALRDELHPQIAGKICFVGYTASGMADLVTSPVYSSMPGVMAHANVLNMLLADRPASRAPLWINLALLLIGGLGITFITSSRGAIVSFVLLLAASGIVLAACALAFYLTVQHVASVPAVAQFGLLWASVTGLRQFTEERARRQFQRALAQYTSPAVAARVARRADRHNLKAQPAEVSCFFSDLEGFTTLSERIGAEKTKALLIPYLDSMSRVLVAHGAMVNKFMGDGIFAFFNAPILPCERHAESACACALDSLSELEALNYSAGASLAGGPLVMRIGISSGETFVGDYGSHTKLDYTCIGDTVNVGARLERANKFFGTQVLVDGTTRRQAGQRFAFRSLGRGEVPGKTGVVELHELLGFADRIDDDTREYVILFEAAIGHFQARAWQACIDSLDRCLEHRPDDVAARRYRDAAFQHCQREPQPEWNQAVSLSAG